MPLELKPGARLRSSVCSTEVIVVRAPAQPLDVRCGDHALVPFGEEPVAGLEVKPGCDTGSAIGKRYVDEASDLELLCTKAGEGSLSVGELLLQTKEAKPLPSSD